MSCAKVMVQTRKHSGLIVVDCCRGETYEDLADERVAGQDGVCGLLYAEQPPVTAVKSLCRADGRPARQVLDQQHDE